MTVSDGWLVAALLPLAALVPVLWRIAHGDPRDRLVAQNLGSLLGALVMLLAARGFGRSSYLDLALVLAVLGPAGTLVYARFLGGMPSSTLLRRTAVVAVPATVLPLCVATGPGRETVKLLVIGALLMAGNLVTSAGAARQDAGTGTGTSPEAASRPGLEEGKGP
ncbi:monovalent cation/H+ antiporter complex subunit F [Streptomyces sp. NPDC051776]|uniref:monovalent cation/H+ antiporter complex subunit F n=1 Tax=Streptomyces sp. NPDC051776 TaxID=3155414 RepID=UPI00342259AD